MSSTASTGDKAPQLSRRMPELDGIRGTAVLVVISFHCWYNLRSFFATKQEFIDWASEFHWIFRYSVRGDLSVDVFFVLSGFLLSWQLFSQRLATGHLNYRVYFAHRIFRIYPIYLLVLGIAFVIQPTWNVLGNITGVNLWLNIKEMVVPWTWSISVELHFYAAIPFLILLITGWRSLLAMVLATCALAAIWINWHLAANPLLWEHTLSDLLLMGRRDQLDVFFQDLYIAVPVRLCEFMFGTIAAWLVTYRYPMMTRLSPGLVAVLVGLCIVAMVQPALHNPYIPQTDLNRTFMHWDFMLGRFTFPAAVGLMIALLLSGHLALLGRLLSARFLKLSAKYSLSMYLFHPLFVYLFSYLLVGFDKVHDVAFWQVAGIFVGTVATSMLVGMVTWKYIEQPSIAYGKRRFDH